MTVRVTKHWSTIPLPHQDACTHIYIYIILKTGVWRGHGPKWTQIFHHWALTAVQLQLKESLLRFRPLQAAESLVSLGGASKANCLLSGCHKASIYRLAVQGKCRSPFKWCCSVMHKQSCCHTRRGGERRLQTKQHSWLNATLKRRRVKKKMSPGRFSRNICFHFHLQYDFMEISL